MTAPSNPLADSRFASILPPDRLARLAARGGVMELSPGELLVRRGAPARALFVVVQGKVLPADVRRRRVLWPGDVCGEIGFLLRCRRQRTLRGGPLGAMVWRLPFRAVLRGDPASREVLFDLLLGLSQTMGMGPTAKEIREGADVDRAIRAVWSALAETMSRREGIAKAA